VSRFIRSLGDLIPRTGRLIRKNGEQRADAGTPYDVGIMLVVWEEDMDA